MRNYIGEGENRTPFAGRQAELAALSAWLENPAQACALVAAPPGRGKSALLVRWLIRLAGLLPDEVTARQVAALNAVRLPTSTYRLVYFPISRRVLTDSPQVTCRAIASSLASAAPTVDQRLGDDLSDIVELALTRIDDLVDAGQQVLLVLDGIDESSDLASLLPVLQYRRSGLKTLVSARWIDGDADSRGWVERLAWQVQESNIVTPGLLSREQIADVIGWVPPEDRGRHADRIHELTLGDPLSVRFYVDDLRSGEIDTVSLPHHSVQTYGIVGYVQQWLERERRSLPKDGTDDAGEQEVEALLLVLASAMGPLLPSELVSAVQFIFDVNLGHSLSKVHRRVGRFLMGDLDGGYVLSHPQLALAVRTSFLTASVDRARAGLKDWCLHAKAPHAALPQGTATSRYSTRFLAQHLEACNSSTKEFAALAGMQRLYDWQAHTGSVRGYLEDLRTLLHKSSSDRQGFETSCAPDLLRALIITKHSERLAAHFPASLLRHAVAKGLVRSDAALAISRARQRAQLMTVEPAVGDPTRAGEEALQSELIEELSSYERRDAQAALNAIFPWLEAEGSLPERVARAVLKSLQKSLPADFRATTRLVDPIEQQVARALVLLLAHLVGEDLKVATGAAEAILIRLMGERSVASRATATRFIDYAPGPVAAVWKSVFKSKIAILRSEASKAQLTLEVPPDVADDPLVAVRLFDMEKEAPDKAIQALRLRIQALADKTIEGIPLLAIEVVKRWALVLIRLMLQFRFNDEQEREAVALIASVVGQSKAESNLQGLSQLHALSTASSRRRLLRSLTEGVEQLDPTPKKLRLLAVLSHFFADEVAVPLELQLQSMLQRIPAELANSALTPASGYLSAKTLALLIARSGTETSELAEVPLQSDAARRQSGFGPRTASWRQDTVARLDAMIDDLMLMDTELRQTRAKPIFAFLESVQDPMVSAHGVLRLAQVRDLGLQDALIEHSCRISGVHERWRSIANTYRNASAGARNAGFEALQGVRYADLQLMLLALMAPYIPESLLSAARDRAELLARDIARWRALSHVRICDAVEKPSLRSFGSHPAIGDLAMAVTAFLSERSRGVPPDSCSIDLADAILKLPPASRRGIDHAIGNLSENVAPGSALRRRMRTDDLWYLAANGMFTEIAKLIWAAANRSTEEYFRVLYVLLPRLESTELGAAVLADTRHAISEVRHWFGMAAVDSSRS